VAGHVDREHPYRDADLRGGEPDAPRGDPHRGDQVRGELDGVRRARVDVRAGPRQHRVGREHAAAHHPLDADPFDPQPVR
jgi:hypothetical protein